MKPTFKRITWRGHKIEVEGYTDGNDVELTSIEGISPLDMYLEANEDAAGQIEVLFSEACNSVEVDSDAIYERSVGK